MASMSWCRDNRGGHGGVRGIRNVPLSVSGPHRGYSSWPAVAADQWFTMGGE